MKILTPYNIDSLSDEEILSLVDDKPDRFLYPANSRLKLAKVIAEILGLELTNDIKLLLTATDVRQYVLATAGSGKTTVSQFKLIYEKCCRKLKDGSRLNGDKVLCLVYNVQNVGDIKKKHKAMVDKLNSVNVDMLKIDSSLKVQTIHSFCQDWAMQYSVKCGVQKSTLLQEHEQRGMMKLIVEMCKTKDESLNRPNVTTANILNLYNYMKERLLTVEDLTDTDKFIDLDITVEQLSTLFSRYDTLKEKRRKYDFTDMLTNLYNLLKEDKTVRDIVRSTVNYVVADEVQDFTPIMKAILDLIASEDTPVICMFDDDQSIYGFRGADSDNALRFNKSTESAIYSLQRNRRCPCNVLEEAKMVISLNENRFNKSILATKGEGTVEYVPYSRVSGQNISIVNKILSMTDVERQSTVICYRNRESSRLIVDKLVKAKIPFHITSGCEYFSHPLFQDVIDILMFLLSPVSKFNQLNLYKCLPVKKSEMMEFLNYSKVTGTFIGDSSILFDKLDFGHYMSSEKFKRPYNDLRKIMSMVETEPLNKYFPVLYNMIKLYYWNFYRRELRKGKDEIDDYFENEIIKFFNVNETLETVYNNITKMKQQFGVWQRSGIGVCLSTFHGLKGLEYDNVFITNMNDEEFPNFALIDSRNYPQSVKDSLKDSETKLLYVAMTRSRKNMYIYYDENNPSYYIKILLDKHRRDEIASKAKATINLEMSKFKHIVDNDTPDERVDRLKETAVTNMDMFSDDDYEEIDLSQQEDDDYEEIDLSQQEDDDLSEEEIDLSEEEEIDLSEEEIDLSEEEIDLSEEEEIDLSETTYSITNEDTSRYNETDVINMEMQEKQNKMIQKHVSEITGSDICLDETEIELEDTSGNSGVINTTKPSFSRNNSGLLNNIFDKI